MYIMRTFIILPALCAAIEAAEPENLRIPLISVKTPPVELSEQSPGAHSLSDKIRDIRNGFYVDEARKFSTGARRWEHAASVMDFTGQVLAALPACLMLTASLFKEGEQAYIWLGYGAGMSSVLSVSMSRGAKYAVARARENYNRMNMVFKDKKLEPIPDFSSVNTREDEKQ